MRILIGSLAVALLTTSAGCDKSKLSDPASLAEAEQVLSNLRVAQNSPDMAIKSWWDVKDAWIKLSKTKCRSLGESSATLQAHLTTLAGPKISSSIECSEPEIYDRTIEDVQIQSETRAIVLARVKNVTPPDPRASIDSGEQRIKDTGSQIRYILERPSAKEGWQITQMMEKAGYSSSWEEVGKLREPYNHKYVNIAIQ